MRNLVSIALAFSATLALGCGKSPCDTLSDLCAKCPDASVKNACETTVSTYKLVPLTGNDACQSVLDNKTFSSCE